jgi:hypothetical protein
VASLLLQASSVKPKAVTLHWKQNINWHFHIGTTMLTIYDTVKPPTGSTGSGSNSGGRSIGGSGAPRSYGGGNYYPGGGSVPYTAGANSPNGLRPSLLLPIAALSIFPGIWLAEAYEYNYPDRVPLRNDNSGSKSNTSYPVICLCQQYSECGCDSNVNSTFISSLAPNGSIQSLNGSVAVVTNVNGTETLVINGTLANGTTAPGGSGAPVGWRHSMTEGAGYWLMIAIAIASTMIV